MSSSIGREEWPPRPFAVRRKRNVSESVADDDHLRWAASRPAKHRAGRNLAAAAVLVRREERPDGRLALQLHEELRYQRRVHLCVARAARPYLVALHPRAELPGRRGRNDVYVRNEGVLAHPTRNGGRIDRIAPFFGALYDAVHAARLEVAPKVRHGAVAFGNGPRLGRNCQQSLDEIRVDGRRSGGSSGKCADQDQGFLPHSRPKKRMLRHSARQAAATAPLIRSDSPHAHIISHTGLPRRNT